MSLNSIANPVHDKSKGQAVGVKSAVTRDKSEQTSAGGTVDLIAGLMRSHHQQSKPTRKTTHSAERMSRLLEVLPCGVVMLNGEGKIQQSNAAANNLLGPSLEGELWSVVIKRDFSPKANNSDDVSLLDGRLVHVTTSPLDGEPGQIVLLQDVTETRQLQIKVSHLQRLSVMGEMAARLAHQIRTPLSSALLSISPLLKKKVDSSLRLRFAKKLHNSISHMEQLVKDMLAFSRGDMAQTAPVSVIELLAEVEQQFLAQPGAEKFNLEVNSSVADGYFYGSKDALTSAINNLVNNARLACESEGEITIYAEYVEDDEGVECIEISVEDNGVGIPKEEQDKILTPFYTTRSSGTGLGLAVVQSIAKAHRGVVLFASDEGEGSTFCLRMPRYQSVEKFILKAQEVTGV